MAGKLEVITNPSEALKQVGTENSELHEELRTVYAELDRYRNALDLIMKGHPDPVLVATTALGGKVIGS